MSSNGKHAQPRSKHAKPATKPPLQSYWKKLVLPVTAASILAAVSISSTTSSATTVQHKQVMVATQVNRTTISRSVQEPYRLRALSKKIASPRKIVYPYLYTVRHRETLSSIAKKLYGRSDAWTLIYFRNSHIIRGFPYVIEEGWKLKIVRLVGRPPAAPPPPPPPKPRRSTVVPTASQSSSQTAAPVSTPQPVASGVISFSGLEQLWVGAGGPTGAEAQAAQIAECESGGEPDNYNGKSEGVPYTGQAAGLWEILGLPFPGNPFDPGTNARMAVAKYDAAGGFSPWVCQ